MSKMSNLCLLVNEIIEHGEAVMVLSCKLNDALSVGLFRADFSHLRVFPPF